MSELSAVVGSPCSDKNERHWKIVTEYGSNLKENFLVFLHVTSEVVVVFRSG